MKKLSDADIGSSSTKNKSHQTHIGLDEQAFRFLNHVCDVSPAWFYYDGKLSRHVINYGLITSKKNPRSPHLNKGSKKDDTIYQSIYSITSRSDSKIQWYLLWATLKKNAPFFLLFDEDSSINSYFKENNFYSAIGTQIGKNIIHFETDDCKYHELAQYICNLLNNADLSSDFNELVIENLDVCACAPGDTASIQRDIGEIGRKGEELIDGYLSRLCSEGEIDSYSWMNRGGESYSPYDFSMSRGKCIYYIDVKTTTGDFDNRIFFSSNEVKFITEHKQYCIYRVYKRENKYNLSICSNAESHFSELYDLIKNFKKASKKYANVDDITVFIKPSEHMELTFEGEINLDYNSDFD